MKGGAAEVHASQACGWAVSEELPDCHRNFPWFAVESYLTKGCRLLMLMLRPTSNLSVFLYFWTANICLPY